MSIATQYWPTFTVHPTGEQGSGAVASFGLVKMMTTSDPFLDLSSMVFLFPYNSTLGIFKYLLKAAHVEADDHGKHVNLFQE